MTEVSKLEGLPDELLIPILVEMPVEDMEGVCRASRRLHAICGDQGLWREKFFRDFSGYKPYFPFTNPSEVEDWREAYLEVYREKRNVLIPLRLQKLLQEYGWKTSYTSTYKHDVTNISLPDLYLVGIFLLPLTLAQRYLGDYLRERGFGKYRFGFEDEWILSSLGEIPQYLSDVYKWLQDPVHNTLDDVPGGTDYGFRQALILLAINNYTPQQAEERLRHLSSTNTFLLPYLSSQ